MNFFSSGTSSLSSRTAKTLNYNLGNFLKAYLVTLVDTRKLVARVARWFMPCFETVSDYHAPPS